MPHTDAIPVSASIVSTGKGIRYIGINPMHCYAYSGAVSSLGSKAFVDLLSFDSGAGYILSEITYMQPDFVGVVGGTTATCKISFNGVAVAGLKIETLSEDMSLEGVIKLIIPPFTTVLIQGNTNTSDFDLYVTITGRVYGAE